MTQAKAVNLFPSLRFPFESWPPLADDIYLQQTSLCLHSRTSGCVHMHVNVHTLSDGVVVSINGQL